MMKTITQEQFNKIVDLVSEMQKVCPDIDTSSPNIWLSMVKVEECDEEIEDIAAVAQ